MTAKEAQREFPIGTWIKFERVYHHSGDRATYNHSSRRTWDSEPNAGVVVGARWKCAGKVSRGHEGYEFTTKGAKVLVLLVRSGYANRPLEVIPRHATITTAQDLPTNRIDPGMAEAYRNSHRENPDWTPRNPETGRFEPLK
jgi:hypothetical protein